MNYIIILASAISVFFALLIVSIILLVQNKNSTKVISPDISPDISKQLYLGTYNLPPFQPLDIQRYKSLAPSRATTDYNKYESIQSLRDSYMSKITQYGGVSEKDVFRNFPINVTSDKILLGYYISNTPLFRYLEKYQDSKLQIKLDGTSINNELNILSSILREKLNYKNSILVFSVDKNKPYEFLELDYIISNGSNIYINNSIWKPMVQNAYTELFLIIEILHGLWHLKVADIIFSAKTSLPGTEILKVFNIADKNVFITASEVHTALFSTSIIFGQILYFNPRFRDFVRDYQTNFDNIFDIDTIFDNYFYTYNHDKNLNWCPGIKSNINIIKQFTEMVFNKYKNNIETGVFINKISKDVNKLKKMLQMLLVIGSTFHSTTIEFTKFIFTDVMNLNLTPMGTIGIAVAFSTIIEDFSVTFGDTVLYLGTLYKDEIYWLSKAVEANRNITMNELQNNKYVNDIFTTKNNMNKTYVTNTFTTYL